jgi:hypothetical protein
VCDAAGNTAAHVASSEGVLDLLLAADRLNRQPAGAEADQPGMRPAEAEADRPSMQPAGAEADQPSMQPAAVADRPGRDVGAEAVKVESGIPAAPASFDNIAADIPAAPTPLPGPLAGMVSRVCACLPFDGYVRCNALGPLTSYGGRYNWSMSCRPGSKAKAACVGQPA